MSTGEHESAGDGLRVTPRVSVLAHIEDEGTTYFYDPRDELEDTEGRWISAEATLDMEDMR